MRAFWGRWDLPLLAAIVLVSLVLLFWPGEPGSVAVVVADGETVARIPLATPQTIRLTENGISLTIQIEDGAVRVTHADCPDRLCVRTGPVRKTGGRIICLPARVVIRVEGGEQIDAVAG